MSEQIIESAAAAGVQAAAKTLAPEAEALISATEARLISEGERLKAEIDASHNGIVVWLRAHLAGQTTPAAPAPAPQS